jgi:hypothetical protein
MEKYKKLNDKRIKELLVYDKKTGALYRRTGRLKFTRADRPHVLGYREVCLDGKRYLAHRLIWCMAYGYFPEHDIDHINGKRDDNRLCNLREVTRACNLQNQKLRKSNKTGFIGVALLPDGRFEARIQNKRLGRFEVFKDAVLCRLKAERDLNWSCSENRKKAIILFNTRGKS